MKWLPDDDKGGQHMIKRSRTVHSSSVNLEQKHLHINTNYASQYFLTIPKIMLLNLMKMLY